MTNDIPQLSVSETGLAVSPSNSVTDGALAPVLEALWPAEQASPAGGGGFTNAAAPIQEIPPATLETNALDSMVEAPNAIEEVAPPLSSGGGKESSPDDSLFGHGTWLVMALLVVGGVVWIVRKLKASTAAFEKSVEDELVDSVLDVVAKDAPDRAAFRQELADVVANGGTLRSGPLAAILRIEDGYEKKSPGRYLRRISLLWRKEGTTGSLTKIECELGWEYIPTAVREEFIKTRQEKVVRLVYDAKESGT